MTRGVLVILATFVAACGAHQGHVGGHNAAGSRIANLERAANYPWTDDGACAVREASGEWRTLVEKCYHALDLSRIRFQDQDHRCGVASADAAAIAQIVGICLLVQPELVVGAVVVVGAVIVAAAIAAELTKPQKCECLCMGVDDLGRKHGPYRIGKTKNKFKCEESCLRMDYMGGGFCE